MREPLVPCPRCGCVRHVAAPCWTCLVLMAMLAYQACLSSPLMDIVRAQDTR